MIKKFEERGQRNAVKKVYEFIFDSLMLSEIIFI